MKVDILAIGVHPDDVELGCGGTLLAQKQQGSSTAIVDLTQGELGTRGTPELRLKEATAAGKILGVEERINLGMADGFFANDRAHQLKLIAAIRYFQPDIILGNAKYDRHPDHGRASKLIYDSCFLSGLSKIQTEWEGEKQEKWRPRILLNYIQDRYMKPEIVVDISEHYERKLEAVQAFSSQFYNPNYQPNSEEDATPISSPVFLEHLKVRAMELGRPMGFTYGEGFTSYRLLGVRTLDHII